jgi:hypothetical protein
MIYIIEVPHRLPPTAWSADTLQDAHARIEACDTTGDIDNYENALKYEVLSESEALRVLGRPNSWRTRHSGCQAFSALAELVAEDS